MAVGIPTARARPALHSGGPAPGRENTAPGRVATSCFESMSTDFAKPFARCCGDRTLLGSLGPAA